MKRTTYLFTFLLAFMVCFNSHAQEVKLSGSRNAVRKSGDVLACLTPAASLATVLILQDWQGLKQGALAGVSTVGMTYALKYLVKKERPDGSDNHSFPSMHTSVSFTGAAFIQRRYGWKWGIPAYAVATYVGWTVRMPRSTTGGCGQAGSRHGYRQCLYLHPSVCPKAQPDPQSTGR